VDATENGKEEERKELIKEGRNKVGKREEK